MSRELSTEQAALVREDFLAYCDYRNKPLYDWKREAFGEVTRRVNGKFKYRLAAVCVARGLGKSKGGADVGEWGLMRQVRAHVLTAALLTDGAQVVMDYARDDLRDKRGVEVFAHHIAVPSTGSKWTITSREHTASRGLHPTIVIYDEIGWARDDELFASLLAAQASVDDPLFLVISTVGRRKSGPLWTIKTLAEGGDPSVLWWYSTENLSPRVTVDFLERQKRILLPAQYAREHQNQWVEAADSFTSAADVDAAMGSAWTEQLKGKRGRNYKHYWDLGAIHDPTVGAAGHEEDGAVYIDAIVTIQGSREEPVQLAVVEQMIKDMARRFPTDEIRVESWQGLSAVQSLQRLGLPVKLFTPTAKSNSEEWPVLAQRLTSRTLIVPPHARLREELLNLVYEVGSQGIKVIDRGSIHQDHCVVVRGICASLSQPERVPYRFLSSRTVRSVKEEEEELAAEKLEASRNEIAETVSRSGVWFPGD